MKTGERDCCDEAIDLRTAPIERTTKEENLPERPLMEAHPEEVAERRWCLSRAGRVLLQLSEAAQDVWKGRRIGLCSTDTCGDGVDVDSSRASPVEETLEESRASPTEGVEDDVATTRVGEELLRDEVLREHGEVRTDRVQRVSHAAASAGLTSLMASVTHD